MTSASVAAMTERPYLLEARGLRKKFGATEVLKGVDLLVEPGSLAFLIGPSGSGKSTLLRCCNRLEEPDAGSIVVDGIDLLSRRTDINAARRHIGMVFQHFNLYPHLMVLGNLTLALRKVVGLSRQEANARAMVTLELVGLADKATAYPAQLSGGQQQRIGIARALALDPKIILMDEPTSALDPELVGSVLAVIKDLRARGITMVIASHEMNFAREAADQVLFLDGGVVIEQGSAEEIFARPREERTQRFLAQVRR